MDVKRNEFWQTLLALGFSPTKACQGTYSNVQLNPRVFEQGIYHLRASELILHFLLSTLDHDRFKHDFIHCWPVSGDPRQAREFRSTGFKWIEEIRKQAGPLGTGVWPRQTMVRRSYLDESKGQRFEEILWALARVVSVKVLERWGKHLKYPLAAREEMRTGDPRLAEIEKALKSCQQRYARRTRDRQQAQKQWRQTELELRQRIDKCRERKRAVNEEFRHARKLLNSKLNGAVEIPETDASSKEMEQLLGRRCQETRSLWEKSAGAVDMERVRVVEDVMERRANKVRLDNLRLVPAAEMAEAWTSWLADSRMVPFRGSEIDLQTMSKMAAVCVGELRGKVLGSEADDGLDGVVEAQEARVAQLKRLRMQLIEQSTRVRESLPSIDGKRSRYKEMLREAVIGERQAKAEFMEGKSRMSELAEKWEGGAVNLPIADLRISRKRSLPKTPTRQSLKQRRMSIEDQGMLVDDEEPDFLVA